MTDIQSAKFWRCDLQVHSPLEREFRPGVDPNQPSQITSAAQKLVEKSLAAGLEAIAVTDHNTIGFLKELEAAAKDKLVVFPAVEISCSDGYHLLCLWNPGTDHATIEAFLNKLGFERGKERLSDGAVRIADKDWHLTAVVEEVNQRGGICIAPHVRRKNGLLQNTVADGIRVEIWQCKGLLAVEDDQVELKPGNFADDCLLNQGRDHYVRERPFARVWGSDAKSYEDIGKESTWIKMSSPTIEGLRQAFLDPGSRIRHPDQYAVNSRDRILKLCWDGGFLNGIDLDFNEQLNCMIGGKGTGKSTVIESLRYVLDLPRRDADDQKQFDKLIENVLPPGARVDLDIARRDGTRFSISRTGAAAPQVRDEGGTVVNLTPSDVIGVDIFSQGQILSTARRPDAHLTLIDVFLRKELADLAREEQELESSLQQNRVELTQELSVSTQRSDDQAAVDRLKEARKVFDKKGVAKRTELRRQLDREELLVADTRRRTIDGRELVSEPFSIEESPDLFTEKLPHSDEWASIKSDWEALAIESKAFRASADTLLQKIELALSELTDPSSSWSEKVRSGRDTVAAVYRELNEEFPDLDLSAFERIDKDLVKLNKQLAGSAKNSSKLEKLLELRRGLLTEISENRRKQFRKRDEFSKQLTEKLNGAVKVSVDFQGQRASLAETLSSYKTKVRADAISELVEDKAFSAVEFGWALLEGASKIENDFGLSPANAAALVERTTVDQKLMFQELLVADAVQIEFNLSDVGETPRYRELSRLSVGQKSTSILLILLAERSRPLIIDQPEDDLDNRFVYQDVVERIRFAKDSRQLILATHNANIPVLGDGELIVALDADEVGTQPAGHVIAAGSIDTPSVKRAVTQILEGGREAFRLRQEKYGTEASSDRK